MHRISYVHAMMACTVVCGAHRRDAIRLFLEKQISGAPVLDDAGRLVGVLSESDLLFKEVRRARSHACAYACTPACSHTRMQ